MKSGRCRQPLTNSRVGEGATIRELFARTVTPTYVRIRRLATDALFERRFEVTTSDTVRLEELGVAGADRVLYVPSGWRTLRRILPEAETSPEDVFIDFGAGKGRIVLLAAMYRLRRVTGVEISERLAEIAARNVQHNRARLRTDEVQFINSDVLDFVIPDDVTIAFFYNPFKGEVFRTVVNRLVESVDRNPRRLRIIYRDPEEERTLLETGRFRVVRTARGMRPTPTWSRAHTVRLYEITV